MSLRKWRRRQFYNIDTQIDWLVEVQESFELNHETLYTAVKMMDLFLSRYPGSNPSPFF